MQIPKDDKRHDLDAILQEHPPPFALLHRKESQGDELDVLIGSVTEGYALDDIDLPDMSAEDVATHERHDVLAFLPFRQVVERGFDCHDDGQPIIALHVDRQSTVPRDEVLEALPDERLELAEEGFDVDDERYADTVRAVLDEEIGNGSGSNFVIMRSFVAAISDYSAASALSLFRRLLTVESGSYWTFVAYTGEHTFVGATPEQHASLRGGVVSMNPISGTYRYPAEGPSEPGVLRFLSDEKEADELYMVVDEELKMMAATCDAGARVTGPYLKEMGRLAHTEYRLDGRSTLDVRDVLRGSLLAPTVTGSPLENACRVIARHEGCGRGYYSGVAALIGRGTDGGRTMDSSILIRTADIDRPGWLSIGVGATLVRDSDAAAEVEETWAKAAGVLDAIGLSGQLPPAGDTERDRSRRHRRLAERPAVRAALRRRNETAAAYWFRSPEERLMFDSRLFGLRTLVVDAEDTFTEMLGHQLRSLGLDVTIRPFGSVLAEEDLEAYPFVVVGPGPGDPRDTADPKIRALRTITAELLSTGVPTLAVCLGHQVLAATLGIEVIRKVRPNQGVQKEIDLFGERERVGFYNTFVARSAHDTVYCPAARDLVDIERDVDSGEANALRGPGFCSVQFHPESLLTQRGPSILSDLIATLVVDVGAENDVRYMRKSG